MKAINLEQLTELTAKTEQKEKTPDPVNIPRYLCKNPKAKNHGKFCERATDLESLREITLNSSKGFIISSWFRAYGGPLDTVPESEFRFMYIAKQTKTTKAQVLDPDTWQTFDGWEQLPKNPTRIEVTTDAGPVAIQLSTLLLVLESYPEAEISITT